MIFLINDLLFIDFFVIDEETLSRTSFESVVDFFFFFHDKFKELMNSKKNLIFFDVSMETFQRGGIVSFVNVFGSSINIFVRSKLSDR